MMTSLNGFRDSGFSGDLVEYPGADRVKSTTSFPVPGCFDVEPQFKLRRDRPLLSLSVCHNADGFAGIYQLLKSRNLNCHFGLKSFSPHVPRMELSLFGYPSEWIR